MKTIEDFIKEIKGSDALKDELKTIKSKEEFAGFLKKYDVNGTVEDFTNALSELSDDDAEAVAGGYLVYLKE